MLLLQVSGIWGIRAVWLDVECMEPQGHVNYLPSALRWSCVVCSIREDEWEDWGSQSRKDDQPPTTRADCEEARKRLHAAQTCVLSCNSSLLITKPSPILIQVSTSNMHRLDP